MFRTKPSNDEDMVIIANGSTSSNVASNTYKIS